MSSIASHASRGLAAVLAMLALAPAGLAQFATPGSTGVRERVAGNLLSADGAPTPEGGDQVAAIFQEVVVGVFSYSGETPSREFGFIVYGDDPDTMLVEGPTLGDVVEFRFYDSSANQFYSKLAVLNAESEVFNYTYGGEALPPFFDDFPIPIDLVPTAPIDLGIGIDPLDSGGADSFGEGGPDTGSTPNYDVDGDGDITLADAAAVLRVVTGTQATAAERTAADVNRDGKVDTNDAIAILRNR